MTYTPAAAAPTAHEVSYLKGRIAEIAKINTIAADFLVMILNEENAARTFVFSEMRKMVEQVASDLRYTDRALEIEAAQTVGVGGRPTGGARAAGYLLEIPEHARRAVVDAAYLQANCTGMRYADAVHARCATWQREVTEAAASTRDRLARL